MTRHVLILIAALTATASTARADYVTQTTGHGPFVLDNPPGTPIWDHGEVQMWDSASHGYGYRGSIGGPFVGYTFVPPSGVTWFARSPHYTYAYACKTSNAPNSCNEWHEITASGQNSSDWQTFGWSPVMIFVGYSPPCPKPFPATKLHYCTAPYTPMDSSGMAAAVIGDGFVAPGLPYGHPLNLANPPTTAGECVANLSDYGLGTGTVVAVYTCP